MTGSIADALSAWQSAIGPQHVIQEPDRLRKARQATFPTHEQIVAIIRPACVSEIQACVEIANRSGVSLYPVSRGYNWGLGSTVPVRPGCVVMELERLNAITDFDDELGVMTVEPGVSFEQAAAFLTERNARHFLSVIGGPPEASIIGNYVERGDGLGPLGDRHRHAAAAEVVLGTGELLKTGFAQLSHSLVDKLSASGLGPSLDGLFCQSSLGVVTRLSVWLEQKPAVFQGLFCSIDSEEAMGEAIPVLRTLQKSHVLQPSSLGIWNGYKLAAARTQFYQYATPQERFPLQAALEQIRQQFRSARWFGVGGLYAPSRRVAAEQRRMVRRALKPYCKTLTFIDRRKYQLARLLSQTSRLVPGLPRLNLDLVRNLFEHSPFLGHPTRQSTRSVYWRKRDPVPEDVDPHRDHCGVHWMCHAVPFRREDVHRATQVATSVIDAAGLEPNLALLNVSARHLHLCVAIMYDRSEPGEDARAMDCHHQVFDRLQDEGYSPYRLGLQSMDRVMRNEGEVRVLHQLKQLLDPNGVISPGRYGPT